MQRYFVKRKEQNNLILEESDIHHIKNVMRMNINDKIEVVYDKVLYICNIDNLDPLTLSVEDTISKENKLNIELTIAIGLVKEQKIEEEYLFEDVSSNAKVNIPTPTIKEEKKYTQSREIFSSVFSDNTRPDVKKEESNEMFLNSLKEFRNNL